MLVCLSAKDARLTPDELRARLLATDPPLVGRVEEGDFVLDPRTLRREEFALAAGVLARAARGEAC